jgi:hypothetical protein
MLLSIESELLQLRAVGMSIVIGATELKKGVTAARGIASCSGWRSSDDWKASEAAVVKIRLTDWPNSQK